jgi:hypothetical protein
MHSLAHLPDNIRMPGHFATCGGGWRNPVCRDDFLELLAGDPGKPILPEHEEAFAFIRKAAASAAGGRAIVSSSEDLGFDGTAMEARIFADAAVCRIKGEPFTSPETTGVSREAVCGIVRFPYGDARNATDRVRFWMVSRRASPSPDRPDIFEPHWSRAARGWERRLATL